jgi:hypothetical protein
MNQYEVKLKTNKDAIGSWECNAIECPLIPHLKALNQKKRSCIAGISTNLQGPVPLSECEHLMKTVGNDSVFEQDGKLHIRCKYTSPNPISPHQVAPITGEKNI